MIIAASRNQSLNSSCDESSIGGNNEESNPVARDNSISTNVAPIMRYETKNIHCWPNPQHVSGNIEHCSQTGLEKLANPASGT